ncbi:MAG: SDR family NAD(P)-dependent oxidoreductase, partial [Saprospiraceae bacterium]|nr:SDR family NAD(P)-dependent oxidoreductase [Saprospiraceae bacterium]
METKLYLIYHPLNQEIAFEIKSSFAQNNIDLELITPEFKQDWQNTIQQNLAPTIFLLSDNFIKSYDALFQLIQPVQLLFDSGKLFSIVTDGIHPTTQQSIPTQITKVSGVVAYTNYWQNLYLEKRKHSARYSEEQKEILQKIRLISTEVSDLLNLFKSSPIINDEIALTSPSFLIQYIFPDLDIQIEEGSEEDELIVEDNFNVVEIENSIPAQEEKAPIKDVENVEPEEDDLEIDKIIEEFQAIQKSTGTKPPKKEAKVENIAETKIEESSSVYEDYEEMLIKAHDLAAKGQENSSYQLLESLLEEYPKNNYIKITAIRIIFNHLKSHWERIKPLCAEILLTDPYNTDAYFYSGELCVIEKDYDSAIEYFEKVNLYNPSYPNISARIVEIFELKYPNKKKKIAKLLKKALKKDSKNIFLLYKYAKYLKDDLGESIKSIDYFKKVLDLKPEHPRANFDLACIYHQLNFGRKASIFYNRACNIEPSLKTLENDELFLNKSSEQDKFNNDISEENLQSKQIVFITGATSGIGKATAYEFAKNNYQLILHGRNKSLLQELKQDLKSKFNAKILTSVFDIRNYDECEKAITKIPEDWKNIDILINNAGLALGLNPIHEGKIEHWETMIDTNVKGLLYMTRLISPRMVEKRKGHIINICSTAGKDTYPNGNVYCATKFAVDTLTKSMRIDLHTFGVRVSQVSPGHVEETNFALTRFEGDKERAKIYSNFNPLKSKDVADAIYYIASRPPYVNIQDILMMGTQQANSTF